jgi:hypothetical protein
MPVAGTSICGYGWSCWRLAGVIQRTVHVLETTVRYVLWYSRSTTVVRDQTDVDMSSEKGDAIHMGAAAFPSIISCLAAAVQSSPVCSSFEALASWRTREHAARINVIDWVSPSLSLSSTPPLSQWLSHLAARACSCNRRQTCPHNQHYGKASFRALAIIFPSLR